MKQKRHWVLSLSVVRESLRDSLLKEINLVAISWCLVISQAREEFVLSSLSFLLLPSPATEHLVVTASYLGPIPACPFFQRLCPNWDVLSILRFHFLFCGCNGVAETSHGSGIREGRRMTAMSDSFMQAMVEGRRVKKKDVPRARGRWPCACSNQMLRQLTYSARSPFSDYEGRSCRVHSLLLRCPL